MENYLVSARKYRPSTFASVVGQSALTATLKNAVATGRLAHSYLFCGSRGVGKTSCARIFAKTINCSNRTADGEACNECASCQSFNRGTSMNIVELDAASNNGVDDMRQLIEQVQVRPSQGSYRVFIVDEVHMLSTAAFNAFLKTLEEPPEHVVFILATTEKHKIIPTILSRCQIYDFHRITVSDIAHHLAYVAQQEGITAEPAALAVIAAKADGALRDALSIFDQVAASSAGNITYKTTIDNLNVLDDGYYQRLLECFLNVDVLGSWTIYKEIRDAGFDSQFFINGLAAYMRNIMVARDPATASLLEIDDEARQRLQQIAVRCKPEFIYKAMCLLGDADLNYRTATNKQFLVELTLAKICQQLSPSHSEGDNGEGQLRPIVAPKTPTAAQQKQTQPQPAAQTKPEPQAQAQPAPAPTQHAHQPAPAVAPQPVRPAPAAHPSGVGIPRISIKNPLPTAAEAKAEAKATSTDAGTQQPFTAPQLAKALQQYAALHPTDHILTNAMRAAQLTITDISDFTITVMNEIQQKYIEPHYESIRQFLAKELSNSALRFKIDVMKGELPRHTLNDSELLQRMATEYPSIQHLISDFNLRLS